MSMRRSLAIPALAVLTLGIFFCPPTLHAGVGFQPVSEEELKMTSEPLAPGAPAIILFRQVDRDDYGRSGHGGMRLVGSEGVDAGRYEDDYFRIKILTEDGRRYANVEVSFIPELETVGTIRARTIRPDGSIAEFTGQVFEKDVVKGREMKYRAKTFTLPDVQVGSVIEYYYTVSFNPDWIFSSNWILSNELFTKKARFSLRPFHNDYAPMSFRWSERLPPGAPEPRQGPDDIVRLEADNIAAFQPEEFMPPENELKARVDFIYSPDPFELDASKFWKKVGKKRNDALETFLGKRGAMDQAVSQIVSPSDSPDVKLEKIYDRVQQLRNTSYEVRKTEQEEKRAREKEASNAEDVWKLGYGNRTQLSWLYLALVRTAGFEAYGAWVSDRGNYFFNPQAMNSRELNDNVVIVKNGGKALFFDPGAAFTPFGLLRWEETGVQGLQLDKDGGSWIQTPVPDSSLSRIERTANLKLLETGDLEGKLTVTFTGLEGMRRRVEERNEDPAAQKKYLEDEVKESVAGGSQVELANQPDWKNAGLPLVAEFTVKFPGWVSRGGRAAFVPVGFFTATEKHLFDHSERVHPIYFENPVQKVDDITIELPAGWQVASIPQAQNQDYHVVAYSFASESGKGILHLKRKLDVNIVMLDTKYYSPLRSFFQGVKTGDDAQIVLQPATAVTSSR